jgi:UDP-GlcNAc:undecaprenyl-phosphate GlcNAc-1-phosphate transferase
MPMNPAAPVTNTPNPTSCIVSSPSHARASRQPAAKTGDRRRAARYGGEMNWVVIAAAVQALVIALAVGRNASALGHWLRLLDYPDSDGGRKRHDRVTPMVGGTAIALVILVATAMILLLRPGLGPSLSQHLLWFGGAVAMLYLIGFADDRFALSPVIRLTAAIGMLMLVISFAPDFSLSLLRFSGQPNIMLLGVMGDVFVLLCLVGLINAVNMADGKDGIVISLALVWTVVLAFRLPPTFAPILAAAGTGLTVMLWFNMRKRLFLGDSGSYAISGMYGLLAIYAYNHDFAAMRADDVAVMFAIPVFDTIRLMAVRKSQGRSMFEADRDHLHHHLHRSFDWPRGLWIYVAMVALPNAGALLIPGTGWAWLGVSAVLYTAVMWRTRYGVAPLRS